MKGGTGLFNHGVANTCSENGNPPVWHTGSYDYFRENKANGTQT